MNQPQTILISGATGALGQAVTARMLQEGHRVIAVIRNSKAAPALPQHPLLETAIADLEDEQALAAIVTSTMEKYPAIDAALLLAGGFAMGPIAHTSIADIQVQLSNNFFTAYSPARQVFTQMQQQGHGQLVFVGAKPALEPHAGKSAVAYALSKSLLFKLAELMNEEAKGTAVKATVVVPGILDTPANRAAMPGANPANWAAPAHVAGILAFLLANEAGPLRETVLKVYANS